MTNQTNEHFRNRISTVSDSGGRVWVYPQMPKGKFYTYRKAVSYFLIAFFLLAPFISVNGYQLLLFNVLERRFNIFGYPFWPQDFHLFVMFMIIGVIFVIIFTVAYGRLFCGWICPQTIFLEMVFRRIEYWIEGDRGRQIRLSKMPWNFYKIRKKTLKWLVFFIISFLIANVFLAYVIGSDSLLKYIFEGPAVHTDVLISLLIFTLVFYFVFAWFREQVCLIVCPYGRLQGVLLDTKSMVVAYDCVRGEGPAGRSKFRKGEDRAQSGKGDCIDCFQCVKVCPTGIDIRNGTQLECVNCTACIDVCDYMMESVGLKKGLIRYASEENIQNKTPFSITPRLIAYSSVLVVLLFALTSMFIGRGVVETRVLRIPGQLFQKTSDATIKNVYTYKLLNKTKEDIDSVYFKLLSHNGSISTVVGRKIKVPEAATASGTFFVEINQKELRKVKEKIRIGVYSQENLIEVVNTLFLGPVQFN